MSLAKMDLQKALLAVAETIVPYDREAQQTLINQIEPVLFDRLMLTMKSTLTEQQNATLDQFAQNDTITADAVYDHLATLIPNIDELIHKTTQDFLNEYLTAMGIEST